ncbi:unnamed protein product [Paramecium sonneborni]|uniref:Uncharacterized protein n=1 Tax=Paramecium sonneborni TaxID=65129 RepID=A0A8S1LJ79_9CILI|nr:unnamed protein product [Paramecium sonneborni]
MIFLQQLIQKRYQVVMKNKLEDLIQYIKEVLQKIIIVVLKYHFSVLQIIESYNQKGQQRLVHQNQQMQMNNLKQKVLKVQKKIKRKRKDNQEVFQRVLRLHKIQIIQAKLQYNRKEQQIQGGIQQIYLFQ